MRLEDIAAEIHSINKTLMPTGLAFILHCKEHGYLDLDYPVDIQEHAHSHTADDSFLPDLPSGLFTCRVCGTAVQGVHKVLHYDWHQESA